MPAPRVRDDGVATAAVEAAEHLFAVVGRHARTLVVDEELDAVRGLGRHVTLIVVSAGEYFAALPTRLVTMRSTACGPDAADRAAVWQRELVVGGAARAGR